VWQPLQAVILRSRGHARIVPASLNNLHVVQSSALRGVKRQDCSYHGLVSVASYAGSHLDSTVQDTQEIRSGCFFPGDLNFHRHV
jgi:hypothetical protein